MSSTTSYTIQEIAEIVECKAVGEFSHKIEGVDYLECASENQAAFLDNPLYQTQLARSKAGLIVIHPKITPVEGKNFLISNAPSKTFQKIIELFIQPIASAFAGIHPSAILDTNVSIGKNVTIGPNVVIDQGVTIGAGCFIGAGSFIGAECTLAEGCHLHPNVTLREGTKLGKRVLIQPGAVIGSSGFGYHTDAHGKHHHLEQLGNVILEDEVEIGANSTIDRARFKTTLIKRGTKIDNLVQIGHQVELGEDNLIVSQVGISGSTRTGRNVVIGGQSGLAGHIVITDQVILAARSGVSKSLTEPGTYLGAPAMPRKEFSTHFVQLRSIGKLIARVAKLETKSKN